MADGGSSNGLADAVLVDSLIKAFDNTSLVLKNWSRANNCNCELNETGLNANATDGGTSFHQYVQVIIPIVFGLIFVLGLFGNSLVMIVIISDKHMRNTTNILIFSLALADLLFILFCVPFTGTGYVMTQYPFGNVVCKISNYVIYVCAYASVYTLVLMSLDRYLAVVHALRSMTLRSERNTCLAIFIVWVIILGSNSPILLQWRVYDYVYKAGADEETRSTCVHSGVIPGGDPMLPKVFFTFFMFFGYVIPLGATVLMYGLMLKRLLYGVVPGGGNQSAESIRAKKRVTRMVVVVVAMFAVCWLPIQVICFFLEFNLIQKTAQTIAIMMAANSLAYMNSCVNPILYAFLSENFRRSFRKLLCCSASSLRRMEYERTNIRFTVTEKETTTTKNTMVSKTYTPV